jgi:hypothetical protein
MGFGKIEKLIWLGILHKKTCSGCQTGSFILNLVDLIHGIQKCITFSQKF